MSQPCSRETIGRRTTSSSPSNRKSNQQACHRRLATLSLTSSCRRSGKLGAAVLRLQISMWSRITRLRILSFRLPPIFSSKTVQNSTATIARRLPLRTLKTRFKSRRASRKCSSSSKKRCCCRRNLKGSASRPTRSRRSNRT